MASPKELLKKAVEHTQKTLSVPSQVKEDSKIKPFVPFYTPKSQTDEKGK